MKENSKFIIFITLLFAVVLFIAGRTPRKFSWVETHSRHDREPFGAYVFDDVLGSSLRNGYEVNNETFYSLTNDSTAAPKSILCVTNFLPNYQTDILLKAVERGNKVMLVNSYFNHQLCDMLNINDSHRYFSLNAMRDYLSKNPHRRDTLYLAESKTGKAQYEFFPRFADGYFYPLKDSVVADTLPYKVLARNARQDAVALQAKIGKGELYLVCNPLIFTNHGMLNGDNAGYIFNLLHYIDDLPVYRTEAYNKKEHFNNSDTPLEYLLSHRPLQWALYWGLFCIVLFMCFTAKRRQRVIPVVQAPVNRAVEFTRLIATLHYQRKDYRDVLHKKYIYFADQLKRNTYIDIEAEELSPELCRRLAEKTGMNADKLYHLLGHISHTLSSSAIDEKQMKELIDQMNEVLTNSR